MIGLVAILLVAVGGLLFGAGCGPSMCRNSTIKYVLLFVGVGIVVLGLLITDNLPSTKAGSAIAVVLGTGIGIFLPQYIKFLR